MICDKTSWFRGKSSALLFTGIPFKLISWNKMCLRPLWTKTASRSEKICIYPLKFFETAALILSPLILVIFSKEREQNKLKKKTTPCVPTFRPYRNFLLNKRDTLYTNLFFFANSLWQEWIYLLVIKNS